MKQLTRSFRLRLVVWSMMVSCVVLAVFSSIVWLSVKDGRLRSLDRSLSTYGFRHIVRGGVNSDSNRMLRSLEEHFGEVSERPSLSFLRKNGEILFQSADWPSEIAPSQFLPGTTELDPQPSIPPPSRSTEDEQRSRRTRLALEPKFYQHDSADHSRYRMAVFANDEVRIVLAADLRLIGEEMSFLRNAFLLALPGAIFLIGLGAWIVSGRALRPIDLLGRDMRKVSAQSLESRLSHDDLDHEFAAIIEPYNEMLARLERSFHQATRFSADASHELKTPLAILRGKLEAALQQSAGSEQDRLCAELLEVTDQQKAILENLLLLARCDGGKLEISAEPIDFSHALELWTEDASLLAEEKSIQLRSEIAENLSTAGDSGLLQQVAHNIFSNAVRHNKEAGWLHTQLRRDTADQLLWTTRNSVASSSAAPSEFSKFFERFYRDEHSSGTGLGLSLVREIVGAHGGEVTATQDTECFTIEIRLPNITAL